MPWIKEELEQLFYQHGYNLNMFVLSVQQTKTKTSRDVQFTIIGKQRNSLMLETETSEDLLKKSFE